MPKSWDDNPANQNWSSYDGAAGKYDELLAPFYFMPPARDLVALLGPPAGSRVLDVGTGTGVAAQVAAEALGSESLVIGVDPSLGMLKVAKRHATLCAVAAQVPDLPFREGAFDVVMANFVISHFGCYETALSDMVRVLKSGGVLGVTAWGNNQDDFRRTWQEAAESFVGKDALSGALRRSIPWEERFSDQDHLQQSLRDAGLQNVLLRKREYKLRMSIADYLAGREISMQGRYIRQTIDETSWQEFRKRVGEVFAGRHRGPVEYTSLAFLVVGRKR